jgi:hypothetical protein
VTKQHPSHMLRNRRFNKGDQDMASHKEEGERREPALDHMEPGRIYGAVIPMSEGAQSQMRDSIEVIEYLLNRERVVWT